MSDLTVPLGEKAEMEIVVHGCDWWLWLRVVLKAWWHGRQVVKLIGAHKLVVRDWPA